MHIFLYKQWQIRIFEIFFVTLHVLICLDRHKCVFESDDNNGQTYHSSFRGWYAVFRFLRQAET